MKLKIEVQVKFVLNTFSVLEAVALNDHQQRWSHETDDKMKPTEAQLLAAADAIEVFKSLANVDTALPSTSVKLYYFLGQT